MKKKIEEALLTRAPDKRISCMEARQVAEELGVEYAEVGAVCNEAGIRIHACELGCFK